MAKRKKFTVNEDCPHCVKLEKKLEELLKREAKYKKQANKLRYKLNELENYARENDYLSKIVEVIEEDELFQEEELSKEKLGVDEEEYFTIETPIGVKKFRKTDKLNYAKCCDIERNGVK